MKAETIKSIGYVVSTASVILLGIVSWSSASSNLMLAVCLIVGMATSVGGMLMRWLSYEKEKQEKQKYGES